MQGDLEGREGRMEELKKQCVPVMSLLTTGD